VERRRKGGAGLPPRLVTLRRLRRNLPAEREGTQSMTTSRFNGGTPSLETDTRAGFGRGSAVREYWLERCQGFSAVGADGRPLGRVKRVETRMEGTFLRLTGIRAREVPVAAIDTVWPSASMLTISAERDVGSQKAVATEVQSERPAWEDETLPWWELFADGMHSTDPSTALGAGRRSFPSVASVRSALERTAEAVATCIRGVSAQSRSLTKALMVEAVRSSVRASQAARSAAARASGGLAKARRRARRQIGRKLFDFAIWIAGSRETILNPDPREGRGGFEDEDTAEIA
jgi:hypothetical protein